MIKAIDCDSASDDCESDVKSCAAHWVFTINNHDAITIAKMQVLLTGLVEKNKVQYAIFGDEVAPTTGTPHL